MKAYLTSRNAAVVAAVAIGVTVAAAGLTTSAEAATLVSEAPFQRHLDLTCNATNSTCFRSVGPVPANERWVIQFVSCTADGSSDPNHTLRNFTLTVSTGTQVLGHHYIALSIWPTPGHLRREPADGAHGLDREHAHADGPFGRPHL